VEITKFILLLQMVVFVFLLHLHLLINNVDYLVVAGGGGGGFQEEQEAGGAGGFRESYNPCTSGCYTASPLASPTGLPVSVHILSNYSRSRWSRS
jgi:hypothetical protein